MDALIRYHARSCRAGKEAHAGDGASRTSRERACGIRDQPPHRRAGDICCRRCREAIVFFVGWICSTRSFGNYLVGAETGGALPHQLALLARRACCDVARASILIATEPLLVARFGGRCLRLLPQR